jgi:hypothetical protein
MDPDKRAEHYDEPGTHVSFKPHDRDKPKKHKRYTPSVHNTPTSAQQRRMRKKENRPIAAKVREQEAKVARLGGAAKKSAQTALDKLRQSFV